MSTSISWMRDDEGDARHRFLQKKNDCDGQLINFYFYCHVSTELKNTFQVLYTSISIFSTLNFRTTRSCVSYFLLHLITLFYYYFLRSQAASESIKCILKSIYFVCNQEIILIPLIRKCLILYLIKT